VTFEQTAAKSLAPRRFSWTRRSDSNGSLREMASLNDAPGIGAGEPFNVQLAAKFNFLRVRMR